MSTAASLLPAGWHPGSPVPSPALAARWQGPGDRFHCPKGLSAPMSGRLRISAPAVVRPGRRGGPLPGTRRSPANMPRLTMPAELFRLHLYKKCRWPGASYCRSAGSIPGHLPPSRRTERTAAASAAADTALLQRPPEPAGHLSPAWRATMLESRIPARTPQRHRSRLPVPPGNTFSAGVGSPPIGQ